MDSFPVTSGIPSLDELLGGLRLGDNVVWQVEKLEPYAVFAGALAAGALERGIRVLYFRFASHPPVLRPLSGLQTVSIAPERGFDAFSRGVHREIEKAGKGAFHVFDNLSALVGDWATDALLANFFQVTCPYLHELETVAYFALTRGRHSYETITRIRGTTQVLIDIYPAKGKVYLHAIKVDERHSPKMSFPHRFEDGRLVPVYPSGEAAASAARARESRLGERSDSMAPWESIYRRLLQSSPEEWSSPEQAAELVSLKQEFARMLLGHHPDFNRLADTYLTLDDLIRIRRRIIGSGRIGGKAAGMLVGRRILVDEPGSVDFAQVLEKHDSFYLGSDVFFTFLVSNGLFRLRLRLAQAAHVSQEEYQEVEDLFLQGTFPDEILERLEEMLDYFGRAPIIIRSSSLLEDSFGNSFAGKYRSEFLANQGGPDARMQALLRALKLVYASALNPDVLSYRRQRGLGDSDEQMAILIQRVSGAVHGPYFFPPLAGTGFSHNLYRWTERIDPGQGLIRLVMGLGTRAVNRIGNDYPRMIALSHPELRPEEGGRVFQYSQKRIDVLDLGVNDLVTRKLPEVLTGDYPGLPLFFSEWRDGLLQEPVGDRYDPAHAVLTCNRLLRETDFVGVLKEMLAKLEAAYGYPVDTEFTAFVMPGGKVKINLLQCRPLRLPGSSGAISIPSFVPQERLLFRASRTMFGGIIRGIRRLVLVDPRAYAEQASPVVKRSLGRVIGRLNRHARIARERFILMGPGRWGSTNPDLGVHVSYADINQASLLVEIADESLGHVPEVSYGTHFFLDLVEAGIIYLPLYPHDPAAQYNRRLLQSAPNLLAEFLPEAAEFERFLTVIDASGLSPGKGFTVMADPRTQQAVCFLEE
ncbi:MAG: PEP/pyruvate-binding domain-containing protein [bacterium]